MERCVHGRLALRTLVAVVVLLLASRFAFQMRDGGALVAESERPSATHFVADAFPTAESSVVGTR